jgi:hypothetical protein
MDSFDFKAIPKLNKMQVLELARCEWPYGDASIAYRLTDRPTRERHRLSPQKRLHYRYKITWAWGWRPARRACRSTASVLARVP